MPAYHTFPEPPSHEDLERHIDAFVMALSKADFETAFQLCPAIKWNKKKQQEFLDPADDRKVREFVSHAVFQAIDGQDAIEDQEEEIDEDDPDTWCNLITPPGRVDFEDLNLSAPDPGEAGEVLANVHLNGEATDITGRYELLSIDGAWVLAFSNFDVM